MASTKAAKIAGDLQVQDDGSVVINWNATDDRGVATAWPSGVSAPVLAEVDPTGAPGPSFDIPNATTNPTPTGFTVQVRVLNPPPQPLQSGITFTGTVASGFAGQTAPITVTASPAVDVVAGPASTFVAAESSGS